MVTYVRQHNIKKKRDSFMCGTIQLTLRRAELSRARKRRRRRRRRRRIIRGRVAVADPTLLYHQSLLRLLHNRREKRSKEKKIKKIKISISIAPILVFTPSIL
jgi:hypothetical protein